jgi:hypothetical protein
LRGEILPCSTRRRVPRQISGRRKAGVRHLIHHLALPRPRVSAFFRSVSVSCELIRFALRTGKTYFWLLRFALLGQQITKCLFQGTSILLMLACNSLSQTWSSLICVKNRVVTQRPSTSSHFCICDAPTWHGGLSYYGLNDAVHWRASSCALRGMRGGVSRQRRLRTECLDTGNEMATLCTWSTRSQKLLNTIDESSLEGHLGF